MSGAEEEAKASEAVEEKTPDEKKDDGEAETKDAEMRAAEEEPAKPKEPEKPKELEEDAPEDKRPKLPAKAVDVNMADATLNVLPTGGNQMLMTLSDGGMQYLLAGARANVGLKAGRHMFEVRIVEAHNQKEVQHHGGRDQPSPPQPRNLVRVGLSLAGSSLCLADGGDTSVSFDSEGFFVSGKSRKKVALKFVRDAAVAILVNLGDGPNANTVSLFRDGVRISEPQPLPEQLVGKALYPHVSYRNVTLQVNFGPAPMAPLPFRCTMVAEAAKADAELAPAPAKAPTPEVIFPVGLPETGYFDFVDTLLEQRPGLEELSDRKIADWVAKSGLSRGSRGAGASQDKPDVRYGLPLMDDGSVRRLLCHVAPTTGRSFVVPELKDNLLAASRKESLKRWAGFKKTAMVVMGPPPAEFKEKVQALILAEKKAKAETERKRKAAEEERKRIIDEKKKKAEEARKAAKKSEDDEAKEDEEAKEEEPAKTEEPEVVVELTEEEKQMSFRKGSLPDMSEATLAKCFAEFSLPAKDEGFDEVVFKWHGEAEAAKVLKEWIFAKKLTQRVDDLQPGQAFKDTWGEWTKNLASWRKLQSEWKDPTKRKALLAKRAEAKKKAAEEKGEEPPAEEEKMDIDIEDLDVFGVEDVTDIGTGEPLFANFAFEDWLLLATRYELHLLLHSFKKDLDDPDRPSFMQKDLSFYFNKYFKKNFSVKSFAVEKFEDFLELVKDTLAVKDSFLQAVLSEDTPVTNFVKLTEDHRRERQRRLDAGDETAELKFPRSAPVPPPRQGAPQHGSSSRPGDRRPQSSSYSSRPGGGRESYNSSRGGGYEGSGQKRPYSSTGGGSYYGSGAKHARTSSYGGSSYSGGGGGGGYGGSYGRR